MSELSLEERVRRIEIWIENHDTSSQNFSDKLRSLMKKHNIPEVPRTLDAMGGEECKASTESGS